MQGSLWCIKEWVMDADETVKMVAGIVVGTPLDALGLVELANRIEVLEGEIRRVKAEIDKKQASKALADSFFKG
jgi:uncharacterized small protein (DUF1192 family)